MGNTYWSFLSLPNMKAIHLRIKVIYNFEKKVNLGRRLPARRPPRHCYFKGQIFLKTRPKIRTGCDILVNLFSTASVYMITKVLMLRFRRLYKCSTPVKENRKVRKCTFERVLSDDSDQPLPPQSNMSLLSNMKK